MPNQATASTVGKPASRVVGTSGKDGLRRSVVTARARNRPSRMWLREEGRLSTARSTRPAITSVSTAERDVDEVDPGRLPQQLTRQMQAGAIARTADGQPVRAAFEELCGKLGDGQLI